MASIATMNVLLTASIGGFASTMNKGGAVIKSMEARVGALNSQIGGLGAIGTAVAGGGMAVLLHNSLEAIDVNAKLSDRLGISTEALIGLQHGAGLAGTNVEELTGGLEKMLKNLAEAATGGGPAKDALESMGLSAANLVNIAPDQAFEQIAQGLTDIQNPAQRAAAAMEVFGKSGQAMLPFLMSGKDGIRAASAEAEKMGLTYSRAAAAQVEAANDAITRMREVFVGAAQKAAIAIAPALEKTADWIRANQDLLLSVVKWTAGIGAGLIVIPKLIGGIGGIASAVIACSKAVIAIGGPWTVFIAAAGLVATVAIRAAAANETWAESAYHVTRSLGGDAILNFFGYSKALLDLGDAMDARAKANVEAQQAVGELAKATSLDAKIDATRDLVRALEARVELTRQIVKLEAEEGSDMGVTDKTVENERGKLAAAQASLVKLQSVKSAALAAFNAPDVEAANHAKAIKSVTDHLTEQAATAGMTAAQIELWKLASEGANQTQLDLAKSLIARTEATQRAADLTKTLGDLEKTADQVGMGDADKRVIELKALGANMWDVARALQAMQKVSDFETFKKGTDAVAELRKEVEQFGATDSQKKLGDLAAMGIGPEQLEQAKKLLTQLDVLNAAKTKADQMQQDAAAVFSATRTPLEKYEATIGKLNDLLGDGAISWDTYGRAVRQAREQLEGGGDKLTSAPAALLKAGSAEAQQFRFDQTRGAQRLTSKDEVPKKQLEEQKAGNRLLNDIERNTRPVKDDTEVLSL